DVVEMDAPQADPEPEVLMAEAWSAGGHYALPQLSGAAPNFWPAFFIDASKLARAFFQPSPDSGTLQAPLPLQSLEAGLSPPPTPLQSFMPEQPCAWTVAQAPCPAHSFLAPAPWALQWLRPQQRCLSELPAGTAASRERPVSREPATTPPRAAR